MENLEISKENKILILERTIKGLKMESLSSRYTDGTCNIIKIELRRKFPENKVFNSSSFLCRDIYIYISEFTRETAVILSSIYNFQCPMCDHFWWYRHDYATRISFLEALITEISKND